MPLIQKESPETSLRWQSWKKMQNICVLNHHKRRHRLNQNARNSLVASIHTYICIYIYISGTVQLQHGNARVRACRLSQHTVAFSADIASHCHPPTQPSLNCYSQDRPSYTCLQISNVTGARARAATRARRSFSVRAYAYVS